MQSFRIVKINYCAEDLRHAVHRICEASLDIAALHPLVSHETVAFWNKVAMLLLGFCVRFKHPAFVDERELRILKLTTDGFQITPRGHHRPGRKFTELGFRLETVATINVGPCAAPETDDRLRRFLADNGLHNVKVDRSKIPYR